METVTCPYCRQTNHTSSPEVMGECAYCGRRFAEVRSAYERLTVLDNRLPDAWKKAEELMNKWQEDGELDREAIVDRRLRDEEFAGEDRRRFVGAGLPISYHMAH